MWWHALRKAAAAGSRPLVGDRAPIQRRRPANHLSPVQAREELPSRSSRTSEGTYPTHSTGHQVSPGERVYHPGAHRGGQRAQAGHGKGPQRTCWAPSPIRASEMMSPLARFESSLTGPASWRYLHAAESSRRSASRHWRKWCGPKAGETEEASHSSRHSADLGARTANPRSHGATGWRPFAAPARATQEEPLRAQWLRDALAGSCPALEGVQRRGPLERPIGKRRRPISGSRDIPGMATGFRTAGAVLITAFA
jgi:hypothetical protein